MPDLIRLDPSSRAPLYRQLKEALAKAILDGHFPQGRIPSSRSLATELDISRNTVQLAYDELLAEGYVTSRPRSGFVINSELRKTTHTPDVHTVTVSSSTPDWSRHLKRGRRRAFRQVRKPDDWARYPYAFIGGQIDAEAFPITSWNRAMRASLGAEHRRWSLQDSQSRDDPLLLDAICRHILPTRGIFADPEEVLVTMGSQHGMYLAVTALCRLGTEAIVESPGYPDAWHILSYAGARIRPRPVDGGGVTVDLPLPRNSIVYVTPSHQFPTNVTLAIERREQLLRAAASSDSLILEDDYDSELRFIGRPTPALKALDSSSRVVYVGSFSKFLAPGLRLGFVVGHRELLTELRTRRRYSVRHPPGQLQRALAIFIRSGDYGRALRRARANMRERWGIVTHSAIDHFPVEIDVPPGGTSLWVRGPGHLDTEALAVQAQARGILFEPGITFFPGVNSPKNYLRIGYGSIPISNIPKGIALLSSMMRQ